ncbi:DeoR/GlpR family DNA-binding transcription regulator [Mesorhizobium neociceri]|uniref:DeoR/GlpR transcriptional regulator n=1 Tax=Mesorhizobium neociceri TaxID=1307853 RepID=A0A838BFQ1_9HYPH|nr:DeoR/GlpR family DNA-binding transcription regulator [Mesorhizobium neociceri]MBA1144711.1 DeoR/GlpR transcriptional regulator [Mesorhizobium neociceri]
MSYLLLEQRQSLIKERLGARGRVLAAELARELEVSEDTIRRDLREMAAAGLCRRVYGGALPISPASAPNLERPTNFANRNAILGKVAARLVPPSSTIFIDAGSTNAAVAMELSRDNNITVVTNSIVVLGAIANRSNIEVILIGGRLDQRSGAVLGGRAIKDAESIHTDICFLGASGVDAEAGITAFSFEEAEMGRSVASASRSIVVAATLDKFGTRAPFAVVPGDEGYTLVTEHGLSSQEAATFERRGINVIRAPAMTAASADSRPRGDRV